jgi:primosomal protein N' (replication factor Y) (superfamily II helicase)
MYAKIVPLTKIPLSRAQEFTYSVPSSLESQMGPGSIVEIPLGRRLVPGVIIEYEPKKPTFAVKAVGRTYTPVMINEVSRKLATWMADYYLTPLSLVYKLFTPRWKYPIRVMKQPQAQQEDVHRSLAPATLTSEQAHVWNTIKQADSSEHKKFLLHGVTGSGKTEIYLRAIHHALENDKQVLLLIPEIALTSQLVGRLKGECDPRMIAVVHSRITPKQKALIAIGIQQKRIRIVVGPRSALFLPYQSLGLIIMDEEHDTSYKQYDQQPRYHARSVAMKLAELTGATLILGSATPSLESYHRASKGELTLVSLQSRFTHATKKKISPLPLVDVVDMREEMKKGSKSIISDTLHEAIGETLAQGEQVILFINRRGMSTFVMCRKCGFVMTCDRCEIPFVYHHFSIRVEQLFCHHCDNKARMPTTCPTCHEAAIKYFGAGTQRVEVELQKLFPGIRVTRMDTDTTRTARAHETLLTEFKEQTSQVLIGTQMITKGLDLPSVSLVGIISVDNVMHLPDFRAHETAFQLLTQVAGRAGRRQTRGRAIIQTYSPDHQVVTHAVNHDVDGFYAHELEERRLLNYPPFAHLAKLEFSHSNLLKAESESHRMKDMLEKRKASLKRPEDIEIIGPSQSFIPKRKGKFHWQIIIKSAHMRSLHTLLARIDDEWIVDIEPVSLL